MTIDVKGADEVKLMMQKLNGKDGDNDNDVAVVILYDANAYAD
jgi:hypothetical protein